MSNSMQETTIKDLYNERKTRIRRKLDTSDIDNQIDKVLGRVTLHKRNEKFITLSDGKAGYDITKGGTFQSEYGTFVIEDIEGDDQIKVNGRWHHKSELEPAKVISCKGRTKGKAR